MSESDDEGGFFYRPTLSLSDNEPTLHDDTIASISSLDASPPKTASLTRHGSFNKLNYRPAEPGMNTLNIPAAQKLLEKKKQSQLLLVSLLENFCALYDQSPRRNRELFFVLCQQLSDMGLIDAEDFLDDASAVRSSYKKAFKELVTRAIESIKQNNSRVIANEPAESVLEPDEMLADIFPQRVNLESIFTQSRFAQDFQETRVLGKGAFGTVVQAFNRVDGLDYAIKKIPLRRQNEVSYEKLLREVKYLARLDHPNVVRYHSAWMEIVSIERKPSSVKKLGTNRHGTSSLQTLSLDDDDETFDVPPNVTFLDKSSSVPVMTLFIQMQLCSCTLEEWLRARNNAFSRSNVLDVNSFENIQIFRGIVQAVDYIHRRKLIHRDIKPSNIFFSPVDPFPATTSSFTKFENLDSFFNGPHHHSMMHSLNWAPKLGDFGLVTEQDIMYETGDEESEASTLPHIEEIQQTSPESTPKLPHVKKLSQENKSRSSLSLSNRTTDVGTATYAPPEQIPLHRSDPSQKEVRQKQTVKPVPNTLVHISYDEKVDIYALGVIFFELYYPFKTAMERLECLKELKLKGQLPDDFVKRWPKESALILWLTAENPQKRPSASEILDFPLIKATDDSAVMVSHLQHQLFLAQSENERLRQKLRDAGIE